MIVNLPHQITHSQVAAAFKILGIDQIKVVSISADPRAARVRFYGDEDRRVECQVEIPIVPDTDKEAGADG